MEGSELSGWTKIEHFSLPPERFTQQSSCGVYVLLTGWRTSLLTGIPHAVGLVKYFSEKPQSLSQDWLFSGSYLVLTKCWLNGTMPSTKVYLIIPSEGNLLHCETMRLLYQLSLWEPFNQQKAGVPHWLTGFWLLNHKLIRENTADLSTGCDLFIHWGWKNITGIHGPSI